MFKTIMGAVVVMMSGQIVAMEQQASMVQSIVIQVDPGYITGTTIGPRKSAGECKNHVASLAKLTGILKAQQCTPVKDIGLYYVYCAKSMEFGQIQKLCESLIGFEAVYDALEYQDESRRLQDTILEKRFLALNRRSNNACKLAVLKNMSQKKTSLCNLRAQ